MYLSGSVRLLVVAECMPGARIALEGMYVPEIVEAVYSTANI